MKYFSFSRVLTLVAGLATMALPATSEARDIKVRRDLDGDGHYNTKKIDVSRGRYDGGRYYGNGGGRYYGGNRYYGGSYYRGGYYGGGYPYYGGYGYGYPYYGSPGVTFAYTSRPSYSSYNDDGYADDLAVDAQRALKRRGYYRGTVDGDIGPGSRSAIRAFQADHSLDVTGRIDRSTMRALGI